MSSKVFYEKRIKKNIKKKQQTNTQEQDLKICTIYLLEKKKGHCLCKKWREKDNDK